MIQPKQWQHNLHPYFNQRDNHCCTFSWWTHNMWNWCKLLDMHCCISFIYKERENKICNNMYSINHIYLLKDTSQMHCSWIYCIWNRLPLWYFPSVLRHSQLHIKTMLLLDLFITLLLSVFVPKTAGGMSWLKNTKHPNQHSPSSIYSTIRKHIQT